MRMQLLAGGVALVAASTGCERKAEQRAGAPATSSSATSAVSAPAASQVATAGASASVRAPLDAGKGLVACGAASCRVGQEVCCVRWSTERTKDLRCIPLPVPPPPPVAWDAETATSEACGLGDYRTCDGPSDCGPGETCCEKEVWMPDDWTVGVQECVPTREGKVACSHDEICNEADSACKRPGATCTEKAALKRHVCAVPPRRRPNCGGSPCPDGSNCYERDGKRACHPAAGVDSSKPPGNAIECDRGSDCAPDESCWALDEHRCDRSFRYRSVPEKALCVDVDDCAAFCPGKGRVASCRRDAQGVGHCECHSKCARDAECGKAEDCSLVSYQRGADGLNPTCDRRAGVCECVDLSAPAKR